MRCWLLAALLSFGFAERALAQPAQPAPVAAPTPAPAPNEGAPPDEAPRSPTPGSDALEPAEATADDVPVQLGPGFYETSPVVVISGPKQRPGATGVRAERRLAFLGEVGWNSLGGFGAALTYHLNPHLSADLGAGLSLTGWKAGLRGRLNLLKTPLTPFAGVGFMTSSGFGSSPLDINFDDVNQFAVRIKPSYFVQAVVGLDYTSPRGFTIVMTGGYAVVLNKNVVVVSGVPTEQDEKLLDVLFGSSIATSVAIGYSFK